MGWLSHLAVIVAVQFENRRVRMANNLHHSPHVGVFFIAAKHLKFAVGGDQQQRRAIFSHMILWSHVIDDRLLAIDAAFGPYGKVCDRVATVGDQSS